MGVGANILLQGLILGLGTLAVMKVTKSKQGAISGNTEAERLFRAASAMQAVVRPGETRGFPTAPSVTFTAWVRQVWAVGKADPTLPVAPDSGSAFLRCSSKGFKIECFLFQVICTLKEGPEEYVVALPLFRPACTHVCAAIIRVGAAP